VLVLLLDSAILEMDGVLVNGLERRRSMSNNDLSLLEIRNLMLETLAYENDDIDSEGKTFKKYGYRGTQDDLFRLMENLAIKKGIIKENISPRAGAWGGSGVMLHPGSSTNFSYDQLNKIYESFHLLLNQGIISPGAVGNMGPNLPNFHVTDYGLRCLEERGILPYDIDDYLYSLNEIDNLDEWVKFYIQQALMCFNANCFDASLIMVGLSNEVLVEILIKEYISYLDKTNTPEKLIFERKIETERTISGKYRIYREHLKDSSMRRDSDLKNLNIHLDVLANETYLSYLRLTRNELAHPANIKTDRITSLMIFISLIKYCERQYKFINYYQSC
jgi:hypothetical protein